MKSFFRKYLLAILFFVVLVIFIVLFAFVIGNRSSDEKAIMTDFSDYNSKITVSNTLPMTDAVGKVISSESNKTGTTGYVEFEVVSMVDEKVNYEIYLTKEELQDEVSVKFVKVYLTDENDNTFKGYDVSNVPTYYDLRLSESNPSGKLLYSGTLKNKGSQKFRLRMWVADTYELTPTVRMFEAKVNVKVK